MFSAFVNFTFILDEIQVKHNRFWLPKHCTIRNTFASPSDFGIGDDFLAVLAYYELLLAPQGSSSAGRASVSKTEGRRFKSCLPCQTQLF